MSFDFKDLFNLDKMQRKSEQLLRDFQMKVENSFNEGKKFLKTFLGI